MYSYKRILVTMDLSVKDRTIVHYVEMLNKAVKADKIYFCHVTKNFDLPEEIEEKYPELLEPVDEKILEQVKDTVHSNLDDLKTTQIRFEVLEGHPLSELLRFIKRKNIDLVLVCKSQTEFSRTRLSEKLCRKAPCSVFMIPANAPAQITRIMVPIDFSDNSSDAVKIAAGIANNMELTGFQCMNVFKLPPGYYKTGKSEEQFTMIMEKNSIKEYNKFSQNIPLEGLNIDFLAIKSPKTAKAILEESERLKSDLIIVGAQGRNSGIAILLGSVTENLIWASKTPVLAVKEKGAGMSLLDAILKL